MLLLYMVCHGSHQYTQKKMLIFIYIYIPAPWILFVACFDWQARCFVTFQLLIPSFPNEKHVQKRGILAPRVETATFINFSDTTGDFQKVIWSSSPALYIGLSARCSQKSNFLYPAVNTPTLSLPGFFNTENFCQVAWSHTSEPPWNPWNPWNHGSCDGSSVRWETKMVIYPWNTWIQSAKHRDPWRKNNMETWLQNLFCHVSHVFFFAVCLLDPVAMFECQSVYHISNSHSLGDSCQYLSINDNQQWMGNLSVNHRQKRCHVEISGAPNPGLGKS